MWTMCVVLNFSNIQHDKSGLDWINRCVVHIMRQIRVLLLAGLKYRIGTATFLTALQFSVVESFQWKFVLQCHVALIVPSFPISHCFKIKYICLHTPTLLTSCKQWPDLPEWQWELESKWSLFTWNLLQSGFVRHSVFAALWNAKPEIPKALLVCSQR